MSKDKPKCKYCYGQGVYKGFWDLGMRRVMDKGPHDTPMFPSEPRYQCDRCGYPYQLPKPPDNGKANRTTKGSDQ